MNDTTKYVSHWELPEWLAENGHVTREEQRSVLSALFTEEGASFVWGAVLYNVVFDNDKRLFAVKRTNLVA